MYGVIFSRLDNVSYFGGVFIFFFCFSTFLYGFVFILNGNDKRKYDQKTTMKYLKYYKTEATQNHIKSLLQLKLSNYKCV